MKYETCLLLTATINPKTEVPNLKRTDKIQRENDYVEAIKYWVDFKIPIVFCENSNTESHEILTVLINSKIHFEYLCFESIESKRGKGHGEIEILSYALENSNIVKNTSKIVKVTGRYKISNFKKIYNDISTSDYFIYSNLTYKLTWADSRLFSFKNDFFYNYFLEASKKINEKEKIYFEHILAQATLNAINDNNIWKMPMYLPIFKGIYGTENIRYRNSPPNSLLKNLIHKIKYILILHNYL